MVTSQQSSPNACYSNSLADYKQLASQLKKEQDSCKQALNQYLEVFEPFSWNRNNPNKKEYFWKDIELYLLFVRHSLVVQNTYPIDIWGIKYPMCENFDILADNTQEYVRTFIDLRNADNLQDKFPAIQTALIRNYLDYLIVEFIYHSVQAKKVDKKSIKIVCECAGYLVELSSVQNTIIQNLNTKPEFAKHLEYILS